MATNSQAEAFAYLTAHEFLVLTTYRKNGDAVPTTVWFANDQGNIYITTQKQAGKLKRIHHTARVEMTPSDRTGTLLGEPKVQGNAHEASADERPQALAALQQKYGEMFTRIAGSDSADRAYIVVEPMA